MKKAVGYGIAILGLVVMGSDLIFPTLKIPLISTFGDNASTFVGIGLVVIGAVLSVLDKKSGSSKVKHSAEEVPIYEGTGKNRKIVGYRREEK